MIFVSSSCFKKKKINDLLNYCKKKATELNLDNQVKFEIMDYRNVTGSFDRCVSVGAFEHFGRKFYNIFFKKMNEVLKDFNGSDLKVESLLDSFEMPLGRGDVLSINNIKIIDDSYNANPESVKAALDHLNSFNGHRKLFVFGDMKELGNNEVNLHTEIGQYAEGKTDIILTVGKLAENAQSNSNNFALSLHFNDNISLLEKLTELLKDGDIILIKGSRGMALESILDSL